jgi:hypothetical protein
MPFADTTILVKREFMQEWPVIETAKFYEYY